jgi:hypothetical protein
MAIDVTYTWNFNPLESYPTASGENDVVFLVHWQLHGVTGSYQRTVMGVQDIPYQTGSTFTPFNELTYNTVYNWITASMGEEQMNRYKDNVYNQIENKINPPVLVQQSPWLPTGSIQ